MATEFIPDECAATAIQACLITKKCFLDQDPDGKLSWPNQVDVGLNLAADARGQINLSVDCIVNALRLAFEAAGEEDNFPALLQEPTISAEAATEVGTAVEDALALADPDNLFGFLGGVIEVEVDENLKPTKIIIP